MRSALKLFSESWMNGVSEGISIDDKEPLPRDRLGAAPFRQQTGGEYIEEVCEGQAQEFERNGKTGEVQLRQVTAQLALFE